MIPATPKAYSLTPPPTVEHPKRYWHTGDTDVDESDSKSGALQRHVYLMASQLSSKCFHFFNTALSECYVGSFMQFTNVLWMVVRLFDYFNQIE